MKTSSDKPFDWIAALALASGAAVIVPSLAALVAALVFLTLQVLG